MLPIAQALSVASSADRLSRSSGIIVIKPAKVSCRRW